MLSICEHGRECGGLERITCTNRQGTTCVAVVVTGAQDMDLVDVERRMEELRQQYLEHKEELARLERRKRAKKEPLAAQAE